jgi:hypothetical protein
MEQQLEQQHIDRRSIGTQQKALAINLDGSKYGAFAEIGAGQEVVRWLFQVGGASGTIAKSISAYDMTVSDAIYGACARYVSKQRLQSMLNHEYALLIERLDGKRGPTTEFFAFADTVAARSFHGSSECHGWMGIKFQTHPRAEPNQILMHVRMLDRDNIAQQQALGIVGVNLIDAAFSHHDLPEQVMDTLLDNLTLERLEVDMIQFIGPSYPNVDHRMLSLKLVQKGLSNAAMFSSEGEILLPSEVLYKRPVLVERGSFRPVTYVNLDILECARLQFMQDPAMKGEDPLPLMEITMNNLMATGEIDYEDFLARADILAATGATVLISNYFEYYRLVSYLARFTNKRIGLAIGILSLRDVFDEKYYQDLEGGIMEAFGRLLKNDLKMFVYPLQDRETGQLVTVPRMKVAPHLRNLFEHFVENGYVEPIDYYSRDYLHIFSRDVLAKIAVGDASWETMVPPKVVALIKERKFFGYSPDTLPVIDSEAASLKTAPASTRRIRDAQPTQF